jgi:glycosyltransferase involved in cell wall biosynthesis
LKPFRKVSVIIPTYQNWNALLICVRALEKQSYPKGQFEVIIINNDADESEPEDFLNAGHFKIIRETKPGSYAARNTGIRSATGEILAFTDSDCIPDPFWIENGVRLLEDHPFARIAGNIELFCKNEDQPTLAELYERVFAFKQAFNANVVRFSVTANMFTWKTVMETTGYFNEEMLSGGDYEWAQRANSNGSDIIYGGDVKVRHQARNTVKELRQKVKRVSGGFVYLHKKTKWGAIAGVIKRNKPPFYVVRKINRFGAGFSGLQKIAVFLLSYYLNLVGAWEELFLTFGKKANRK